MWEDPACHNEWCSDIWGRVDGVLVAFHGTFFWKNFKGQCRKPIRVALFQECEDLARYDGGIKQIQCIIYVFTDTDNTCAVSFCVFFFIFFLCKCLLPHHDTLPLT